MATFLLLPILVALNLVADALSQSFIQIPSARQDLHRHLPIPPADYLFCDSWRFSVETNDAGKWTHIPSRCQPFVREYMSEDRYLSDCEAVSNYSLTFAKSVHLTGDGKDAWVFDVDETLVMNIPYYALRGFGCATSFDKTTGMTGTELFDEESFDSWVDMAVAPALPPSLSLYKEIQKLGFTIILLTGRSEYQRNVTEKNLLFAGYSNWERLLLRSPSDRGKPATAYKSEKRMELVNQGFRIHGSSGDQWSDLLGFAVAHRSFKLPNPMYYIP